MPLPDSGACNNSPSLINAMRVSMDRMFLTGPVGRYPWVNNQVSLLLRRPCLSSTVESAPVTQEVGLSHCSQVARLFLLRLFKRTRRNGAPLLYSHNWFLIPKMIFQLNIQQNKIHYFLKAHLNFHEMTVLITPFPWKFPLKIHLYIFT